MHNDLGLIISNKIYVSSETEDYKQRIYDRRDIKQSSLKVQKVQDKETTKNPLLSKQKMRL